MRLRFFGKCRRQIGICGDAPAGNALRTLVLPCTSFGPLDHELLQINGICWFVPVGAAIGRPQRWAWYTLRFDGKAQKIRTLRAAQWPPLQWHMDCCKLQFQDVFWSRGPKDVGFLPSVRDALSAATRRQIPISHVAYTLVALYHFRVQLSIGQTFNEMVK